MTLKIQLGSILDATYHLALTGAPRAYDGFGTIHLTDTYCDGRDARLVLVRDEHKSWQFARYGSGGYTPSEEVNHYDEKDIVEELYKRLITAA